MKQVAHCFVSPSGSTRKAGRKICSLLEDHGYETREFDLARSREDRQEVLDGIRDSTLLLIGSPVYADHSLAPVMSLLADLPRASGKPALAYVTYGGVNRGISLFELAEALGAKGYSVLGLAEVLAAHSMMFRSGNPVGKGHPGEEDWDVLASWINELAPLLENGDARSMDFAAVSVSRIDRVLDAMVFKPRVMRYFWPPVRFRPGRCTECGACRSSCPTGRLDDLPRIDNSIECLYCYQCVRSCREGAFDARMKIAHPAIRLLSSMQGRRSKQATRSYT